MFRPVSFTPFLCVTLLSILVSFAEKQTTAAQVEQADLIVYGGTASGIMTAYSASQEGLRVILLEPGNHLGGMVTGGLSATDLGQFQIIGGYARDFYMQAAAHYGVHDLNIGTNWLSEPHVGEAIFRKMMNTGKVEVHFGERLKEHDGVFRSGPRIVSIQTTDGKRWRAQVYADCSYEGDLMAQAGVNYTYGREAASEYGEESGRRSHAIDRSPFSMAHVCLRQSTSPVARGRPWAACSRRERR